MIFADVKSADQLSEDQQGWLGAHLVNFQIELVRVGETWPSEVRCSRNALSPTLRYALPNTPRSFSVFDEIPPVSMVPRYDCGSPMNVYNHS